MAGPLPEQHAQILAQKLADGQLALFVGAGLSLQAVAKAGSGRKLPLWKPLAEQVAAACHEDLSTYGGNILDLFDAIVFGQSRFELEEAVRRALDDRDFDPSEAHRALAKLPWAGVYTTNYDGLLGRVFNESPIVEEDHYDRLQRAEGQRPRLFHVHGTLEKLHTLTRDDYRLWPENHPRAYRDLEGIVLIKTVLFVGYSLSDPHLAHGLLPAVRKMTAGREKRLYAWMWQMPTNQIQLLDRRDKIEAIPIADDKDWVAAFRQLADCLAATKRGGPSQKSGRSDQKNSMAKIFISYAREDRAKAQQLACVFEERGWSVWWDTRLKAGQVWDEVIERELSAACCVVVLWSRVSIGRRWVRAEANEGLRRGILIPALIENVRPPLAFRLVQAEFLIDWSGDRSDAGLLRLLSAIGDRLEEQVGQADQATTLSAAGAVPRPDLAVFRDVDAPWCPEMVVIPPGSFLMGSPEGEEGRTESEGPQHWVTIAYRFAIGRYAITVGEYGQFINETRRYASGGMRVWTGNEWKHDPSKSWRDPGFPQTERHPVVGVSWELASKYCEWLSQKTGQPYRLPSEAEWEYACRAGTTTPFSFGETITPEQANYDRRRNGTVEVGTLPANPWELHEMHGNVYEWVEDVFHGSYKDAPNDGSAWTEDNEQVQQRVRRGGAWISNRKDCRSAHRLSNVTEKRVDFIGFRVAQSL